MKSIYIIGSLRNPNIPNIGALFRSEGFDAFDDWYGAGPEADDYWRTYEMGKGNTFEKALNGHAAWNVFNFDRRHLARCDAAVLVLPAGRSGHLELGFVTGLGKPAYILLDQDYDRWDVMYRFAKLTTKNVWEIVEDLNKMRKQMQLATLVANSTPVV